MVDLIALLQNRSIILVFETKHIKYQHLDVSSNDKLMVPARNYRQNRLEAKYCLHERNAFYWFRNLKNNCMPTYKIRNLSINYVCNITKCALTSPEKHNIK